MKSQRLWILLMLTGLVVMGYSFYAYKNRPAAGEDPNTPPAAKTDAVVQASSSTSAPAPAPAPAGTTAPSGAGAATPASLPAVEATTAPATASATIAQTMTAPAVVTIAAPPAAGRDRWYQDQEAQGPERRFALGSLERDAKYPFKLEVSTEGAGVLALWLTDYFATVADKKLAAKYPHDHGQFEKEVAAHPEEYGGNYCLLNYFQEGQRRLPLATRRLKVWLPGTAEPVSWRLDNKQWRLLEGPTTGPEGNQVLRLAWSMRQDPNWADAAGAAVATVRPFLTVLKTYEVHKSDYSVCMSLEVRNESDSNLAVALEQDGPAGIPPDDPTMDPRQVVIGKVKDATEVVLFRSRAELPAAALGQPTVVGYSREPESRETIWIGQSSKYFGSMMYPHPAAQPATVGADANALAWPDGRLQFNVEAALEGPSSRTYLTSVTLGKEVRDGQPADAPIQLKAGGSTSIAFDVFAGPKKRDLFADVPLYERLDYHSTIQFRSSCTFDWLVLAMMWLLQALSYVALGNYGVAIILLVILVRLAMHPLTKKGQVMMSKSQKMGPAVEKLKAKYADDKEQLQKEMMQLYKQQGFTPLLGCLPMMLQLPIWAALWGSLSAAVELRHAAFLPIWLTDLSSPDAVYKFSFALPVIGHNLNLLPILGCISTYIQMKYTPQSTPATTPDAQRQQAMMRYMMPVMMGFMFYSMPSGLNLYIMVSGFFAAAEQYVIRKHIQQKEAEAAAATTFVDAGKAFRGNRPKKPKGPLWTKRG